MSAPWGRAEVVYFLAQAVKTPTSSFRVERLSRWVLNRKRTALAGAIKRRERKPFCALSALGRFHTAWDEADIGSVTAH
jgi:hypothetical protein